MTYVALVSIFLGAAFVRFRSVLRCREIGEHGNATVGMVSVVCWLLCAALTGFAV